MKKTLFTLIAFVGIVQADETPTYLTKDGGYTQASDGTISLEDVAPTFNAENGTLPSLLTGLLLSSLPEEIWISR